MKERFSFLCSRLGPSVLCAAFVLFCAGRGEAFGAPPDDFVTGGGWIDGTPSGARANFGFEVGVRGDGVLKGNLNYVDHGESLHVKSTDITSYLALDPDTRQIEGTATADGATVTFVLVVSDQGEPGRDDTFELTLSNGYSASGTLEGGNVQLHD